MLETIVPIITSIAPNICNWIGNIINPKIRTEDYECRLEIFEENNNYNGYLEIKFAVDSLEKTTLKKFQLEIPTIGKYSCKDTTEFKLKEKERTKIKLLTYMSFDRNIFEFLKVSSIFMNLIFLDINGKKYTKKIPININILKNNPDIDTEKGIFCIRDINCGNWDLGGKINEKT